MGKIWIEWEKWYRIYTKIKWGKKSKNIRKKKWWKKCNGKVKSSGEIKNQKGRGNVGGSVIINVN